MVYERKAKNWQNYQLKIATLEPYAPTASYLMEEKGELGWVWQEFLVILEIVETLALMTLKSEGLARMACLLEQTSKIGNNEMQHHSSWQHTAGTNTSFMHYWLDSLVGIK